LKKIIHSILCIFITSLLIQCKQSVTNTSGIITLASGEVKINDLIATNGSKVSINDIITTGPKSIAVIQFDDKALVTIQSNTYVKILTVSPTNTGNYEFFEQYGNTFSKIKKGTKFSIKTPTLVASVRGTSFQLKYDTAVQKTDCSVLSGIVAVSKINTERGSIPGNEKAISPGDEVLVNAGYKVTQQNDAIETPTLINDEQKVSLHKLDSIKFISDLEKSIESETVKETPLIDDESEQIILDLISEEKNVTLDGISIGEITVKEKPLDPKQIYQEKLNEIKIQNNGKLDKITLRDGQVIMGMIKERGMIYKIETPNGLIDIQPKDIESQIITH